MGIEEFVPCSFRDFSRTAARNGSKKDIGVKMNAAPTIKMLPATVSEVTENLILSSASSVNIKTLETLQVTCVVNVAPELPDTPLHRTDVIYYKIPIMDSRNSRIYLYFDEAADLIDKVCNSGGKTLIYCVAGISRSASICLAYLMKYQGLTLLDSYNYMKLRRSKVKPNCSFFKQLIDYEKKIFGTNTVRMIFNELVQMEIPEVYECDYRWMHPSKYLVELNGEVGKC